MKERLNKSANCFKISLFWKNNNNILFGPEALLGMRENMILVISSLSVGCRNIALPFSLAR